MTLSSSEKKVSRQTVVAMTIWILFCFVGLMGKRLAMPAFDVTAEYRQAREQVINRQATMDQRNVLLLFGGILAISVVGHLVRRPGRALKV